MVTESNRWLSAHIHFDGNIYSSACDKVILQVVAPCVKIGLTEGLFSRYFFIRYGEGGAHVRLRLCVPYQSPEQEVQECITSQLQSLKETIAVKESDSESSLREQKVPAGLGVRWMTYEPEVNRYGGALGIKVAEQLFYCSSEACLTFLQNEHPMENASRLGKALIMTLLELFVFFKQRRVVGEFAELYGNSYLRTLIREEGMRSSWSEAFRNGHEIQSRSLAAYIHEMWSRLEDNESVSEVLDRYRGNLEMQLSELVALVETRAVSRDGVPFFNADSALRALVPSYVHMMNNRIGITPLEESYVCHLIWRTLSHESEEMLRAVQREAEK